MSACTSGCPTQDHASYGQCLKEKNTRVAYCDSVNGSDFTAQKAWDYELEAYRKVRKQGIQPDSTKLDKIEEAARLSDAEGMAYGRDFSRADPADGSCHILR